MRLYIYLFEVTWTGSWWITTAHLSNGDERIVSQDMWKWTAVREARRACRRVAKSQGTNRRLELQVRTKDGRIKIKDSYGKDPRSVNG